MASANKVKAQEDQNEAIRLGRGYFREDPYLNHITRVGPIALRAYKSLIKARSTEGSDSIDFVVRAFRFARAARLFEKAGAGVPIAVDATQYQISARDTLLRCATDTHQELGYVYTSHATNNSRDMTSYHYRLLNRRAHARHRRASIIREFLRSK